MSIKFKIRRRCVEWASRSKFRGLARLGSVALVGLALALGIRELVFQPFYIPSASMTPTLRIDERIVVDKTHLVSGNVHKGDIIVFKDPGGWIGKEPGNPLDLLSNISNFLHYGNGTVPGFLVKRVVGVEGDRVSCCDPDGRLLVNGQAVAEPYLSKGSAQASDFPFQVLVPKGSYWVLGDNRIGSADSRFHADLPTKGFVRDEDVVGVAVAVTWPLDRLRWILGSDRIEFQNDATRRKK